MGNYSPDLEIFASLNNPVRIEEALARATVIASTTFRPDQIRSYEKLIAREIESGARWVLSRVLENARVAEKERIPLCNDTGIPHLFLEIGDEVNLPAGILKHFDLGIAEGLRLLPGRPMGVKGDDIQRMTQSEGLFDESEKVFPAPVQIRRVTGKTVKATILMLGGGPELQGRTQRIFHKHSRDVIVDEMIKWAKEGVFKLGCTPATLAFGVGRTQVEASSLSLEAMRYADFDYSTPLEDEITSAVNKSGVGPLGLGGPNTVLGTFVRVGSQRASGFRVLSLRVGCCYDPRRATVVLTP